MSANEYEIAFVIPDLADPFDHRIARIEESMDVVVAGHGGLTVATVVTAGADAVAAGRRASAVLSSCGLPAERTYPDLVSRQDIADRLDVSRQAVGNWVRGERHAGHAFPAPINSVVGGVWLWGDIVDWLRGTGRGHNDRDLEFPSLEDHARLDGLLIEARPLA